jgi:hypothetical protein
LPSEDSIKRLPFIRYLYNVALQQSRQPKPMNAASILTFHDSVELFLHLSCRELGINVKKDMPFIQYWEALKNLPNGTSLGYKSEMDTLNTLRVNLKHQGIMPDGSEIESSRVSTTNFFEKSTPTIFSVDFDRISMTDLVRYIPAREGLNEAATLMEQEKFEDALAKIAIAFDQIIEDYESRKASSFGTSPFFFGKSLALHSSFFMGISERKMKEFIDTVKDSIESMQKAMKILSLSIDYKQYVKFRLLVPQISRPLGSNDDYFITPSSRKHTADECRFCYGFVIDSAIRIQDFDFDEVIPRY